MDGGAIRASRIVEGARREDVEYVVAHASTEHRAELESTTFENLSVVDQVMCHVPLVVYTFFDRSGFPAVVCGLHLVSPGVAHGWMLATPRIGEIGIMVTRKSKQVFAAILDNGWAHRIQAVIGVQDRTAARWLERLGFHQESTLRAWGKHGEDFMMFRRLSDAANGASIPQPHQQGD